MAYFFGPPCRRRHFGLEKLLDVRQMFVVTIEIEIFHCQSLSKTNLACSIGLYEHYGQAGAHISSFMTDGLRSIVCHIAFPPCISLPRLASFILRHCSSRFFDVDPSSDNPLLYRHRRHRFFRNWNSPRECRQMVNSLSSANG